MWGKLELGGVAGDVLSVAWGAFKVYVSLRRANLLLPGILNHYVYLLKSLKTVNNIGKG